MCAHGFSFFLSPSQLPPGTVGARGTGKVRGFCRCLQGEAIHARCVEVSVCVCVCARACTRQEGGEYLRPSKDEEGSKEGPLALKEIIHRAAHMEHVLCWVLEDLLAQ